MLLLLFEFAFYEGYIRYLSCNTYFTLNLYIPYLIIKFLRVALSPWAKEFMRSVPSNLKCSARPVIYHLASSLIWAYFIK